MGRKPIAPEQYTNQLAALTIIFGFVIVFNPNMMLMSIWVFTGLTMILEGIFDAVALFMQERGKV